MAAANREYIHVLDQVQPFRILPLDACVLWISCSISQHVDGKCFWNHLSLLGWPPTQLRELQGQLQFCNGMAAALCLGDLQLGAVRFCGQVESAAKLGEILLNPKTCQQSVDQHYEASEAYILLSSLKSSFRSFTSTSKSSTMRADAHAWVIRLSIFQRGRSLFLSFISPQLL